MNTSITFFEVRFLKVYVLNVLGRGKFQFPGPNQLIRAASTPKAFPNLNLIYRITSPYAAVTMASRTGAACQHSVYAC